MATTNRYLHLAGVVFRAESEALAARYNLGPAVVITDDSHGPDRYKVVPNSENLREPETTEVVDSSGFATGQTA